jgi:hypothetical protein
MDVDRMHWMMGMDEFATALPVLLGEITDRCHERAPFALLRP